MRRSGAAGGEVLLDQRVRRAGSHHQKLVVLRHPRRTARDVAFAGGIDLCHARRDDVDHLGDPQGLWLASEYGPIRPGTTSSWSCAARSSACSTPSSASAGRTRARWTRHPTRLEDMLAGADLVADPFPEQPPSPEPAGPRRVQVLRTYPAIWPRYPLRAAGRALGRPWVRQGLQPRPAPGLPRGPVHVVTAHRPGAGRRAAPQPAAAPRRRRPPPLRRGRPARAAAQPGRPAAGDRDLPQRRPGPGARVRPREPRGNPDLRAREGRRHRRRVGLRRQRQPQPPLLEPRQRAVLRRPRRDSRRARARGPGGARRRRPPLCPRAAPHPRSGAPRAARGRSADPDLLDPDGSCGSSGPPRPLDAWHGGGPGRTTAARTAAPPPARDAAGADEGLGGPALPPGLRPGRSPVAVPAAGRVVNSGRSATLSPSSPVRCLPVP